MGTWCLTVSARCRGAWTMAAKLSSSALPAFSATPVASCTACSASFSAVEQKFQVTDAERNGSTDAVPRYILAVPTCRSVAVLMHKGMVCRSSVEIHMKRKLTSSMYLAASCTTFDQDASCTACLASALRLKLQTRDANILSPMPHVFACCPFVPT